MQLLRLLLPTVLLPTLATTGTRNTSYPFKDTSLPIERRLDDLGTLPEGTTVRPWLGYPAAVAFHSTDGTSCTREADAEKTIAHTTVVR
jgi:hypothetical protein